MNNFNSDLENVNEWAERYGCFLMDREYYLQLYYGNCKTSVKFSRDKQGLRLFCLQEKKRNQDIYRNLPECLK